MKTNCYIYAKPDEQSDCRYFIHVYDLYHNQFSVISADEPEAVASAALSEIRSGKYVVITDFHHRHMLAFNNDKLIECTFPDDERRNIICALRKLYLEKYTVIVQP